MLEQIKPINYHQVFVERLVENINMISTSSLNESFLERAARSYDPSINGYDPTRIASHLKNPKLVVPASSASDEGKRERAEAASLETLYRQIDSAIMDAGEYVLKELMRGVRNSSNLEIQSMQTHRIGVLEFAMFYVEPDKDESAVRNKDYIDPMEAAWTSVVKRTLDNQVRRISNSSQAQFDAYETPGRVDEEKKNLDGLVSQYDLGARADSKRAYVTVAGIERSMYRHGHDDLISKLSITDADIETNLTDTALVVDYGKRSGLSQEDLSEARFKVITSRLEFAVTDFDVYETPKRMEIAREQIRFMAQEFDRLGITSDQEVAKTKEIINSVYGRAFYILLPTALEGIINLDSQNKNVVQDAERALKDVQLTLDYALRGGVDNNQILDVAHEMLDENSRNARPNRLAGIVREGVGLELQKDLGRWDPDIAISIRKRGEQREAEGKVLMTMHPTIEAAIKEQMEGVERIEDLGNIARIRERLRRFFSQALEDYGEHAQYGYHRRF